VNGLGHVNGSPAPRRAYGVTVEFDEYVRLQGPALVRLARLIAGDRHLGEDLAQDVLAKAYPRWARIIDSGRPDVYLRRMLVNAHVSWRRRRSSTEVAAGARHADAVESRGDGDIGAEAADRDAMWRLIRRLPPKQRATIVLRFYEDLDDATIAEILGCAPVTVRTHTMRALTALRAHMNVSEESVR
jgi:RNA polymerase sigma-70 factor (sigma-E family)